jgi:hypothetical protein
MWPGTDLGPCDPSRATGLGVFAIAEQDSVDLRPGGAAGCWGGLALPTLGPLRVPHLSPHSVGPQGLSEAQGAVPMPQIAGDRSFMLPTQAKVMGLPTWKG